MDKYSDLKNECIAIGSLPHNTLEDAVSFLNRFKYNIPFCPQLSRYSKNEDMLIQFLENMPGVSFDSEKISIDENSKIFQKNAELLFSDYAKILNSDFSILEKYAVSEDFCAYFKYFIKNISDIKPKYAKTQVTGPFTLSVNIFDSDNNKACFNDNIFEIITKTLALKALWQIQEIKKVSSNTIPIIFIDEPTISQIEQFDNSVDFKKNVLKHIKFISDLIKKNGAISAIHCCGDCNWSDLLMIDFDMINFDAYTYSNNFSKYAHDIKRFLEKNGKIVWGIVPTLDKKSLINSDLSELEHKLYEAKSILNACDINDELIENNSLISSSCGCATLSVELAEKTFKLTKDLSEKLKG